MYKRQRNPRLCTRTFSLGSCSARPASLHGPEMTFCYQRQCEDSCLSPCGYGTVFSSRSYDCGSPCGSQGYYGRFCGYRDCCPSFSSRYCSPFSSRYFQRYSYGSCYPCYQC
ncbi:hypothetical protein DUI87_32931 [Hirundo rustica rustica]|uniref:Uncharacterized protein n=1 Tax=Hirundo rustica rustica TaxID=333673 RepID=A0A3M0IP23_HIRRU|nr:hypothetical protein DUI87_32931 [Hirundo rustica rustica]